MPAAIATRIPDPPHGVGVSGTPPLFFDIGNRGSLALPIDKFLQLLDSSLQSAQLSTN